MANWNSKANDIFLAALDLAAAERPAYLDSACGTEMELRRAVEAMLAAHAGLGSFLERPAETIGREYAGTAASPEPLQVGSLLAGRYKLAQQIGEGGMGVVWLAEQQEPVRRLVALKVIKPGMDSAQVIARFEAERQALALMDHPHIARVLDAGTAEGRPYFVMELVKGVPITRYCDEQQLSPRERLALMVPVCQAVQHAHQKGIIHRDLKPSNVLVAPFDGRPVPKVIDFGIAKAVGQPLTDRTLITGLGSVMGTLEYMSPEQAELNNLDVDTRSDVYSLGVLLYELLTGSTPLTRARLKDAALLEVLRIIREEDPPTPSTRLSEAQEHLPSLSAQRRLEPARLAREIRGELDWIVMKALDKDRGRRYETALGMARDIERFLADEAVEACPPSTAYRLRKFLRRQRGPVLAASVVLLALVAGVIGTSLGLVRARWAEQEANAQRQLAEAGQQDANDQRKLAELRRQEASDQRALADKRRQEAERARDQANQASASANAVNNFLIHELLSATAPLKAQGRKVTLEEVLQNAADKVGTAFPNQPQVEAAVRTSLLWTYCNLRLHEAAEKQAQAALQLRRQAGEETPDTLQAMFSLAAIWREQQRLDEAEPLLRKTLEGSRRLLGEEHELTLSCFNNLAALLWSRGQAAEAAEISRQALPIFRRVFGEDHPNSVLTFVNLAEQIRSSGKAAEAEPLAFEALKTARRALGDTHPYTLTAIHNAARVLQDLDRLEEAEPLYREALANAQRVLGKDDPYTLGSQRGLMEILPKLISQMEEQGRFADAERRYREILDGMREELQTKDLNPDGAVLQSLLAACLVRQGKFAPAEPLLRECQDVLDRHSPDGWLTFQTRAHLGMCLVAHKAYADAEPLLVQAFDELHKRAAKVPPWQRVALREAAESLVKLYDAWEKPEEAARWGKQVEELPKQ